MLSTLDSDPYCPESTTLHEAIYGKNLISLGGLPAIDSMFSDLNLHGLKALDIGFGMGGVAFYLAKTHQMEIAGVEVQPWMVTYAQTNAPPDIAHLLKFNIYDAQGEIPFDKKSFDMVYSKGVLNHIKDKNDLFRQIYSLLKPGGLFVIADWIYPHPITDGSGPMAYETQSSYQKTLINAGFQNIEFRNDSKQFLSYVRLFLENLADRQEYIKQTFGEELFSIILKQHQELLEEIKCERKIAVRIVANKLEAS